MLALPDTTLCHFETRMEPRLCLAGLFFWYFAFVRLSLFVTVDYRRKGIIDIPNRLPVTTSYHPGTALDVARAIIPTR
jgi:hypothetical protein